MTEPLALGLPGPHLKDCSVGAMLWISSDPGQVTLTKENEDQGKYYEGVIGHLFQVYSMGVITTPPRNQTQQGRREKFTFSSLNDT